MSWLYVHTKEALEIGNEYHDAGCADSDIICALDLREGKDQPQNLGPKEFDNTGKTTGILLQLTKPVWSTGKVFVLDSGFCVVQALVELKKKGLFAAQQNKLHISTTKMWETSMQSRAQWMEYHFIFMQ